MSKISMIQSNPYLEQHFIFYVGLRHMHRYYWRHFDPTSEYDVYTHKFYFETMRDSAYEDLTGQLAVEVELYPVDQDFDMIMQAVIDELVNRMGMDAIVSEAKEIIRELEGREPSDNSADLYVPDPDACACPACNVSRFPLMTEDLPQNFLGTFTGVGQNKSTFWFCPNCRNISDAYVHKFKDKSEN